MINYIWGIFILGGIFYSFIKGVNINNEILLSVTNSIELIIALLPIMCLWLGIMNIAKKSGFLDKISNLVRPLLSKLFPEIPKNSNSFSYIASSIIMNVFGLGNAATPFGLKAMKELQKENKNKEVASRSMITFLVITTASVTLIPTTVISLRVASGSSNPTSIVGPSILVSFLALFFGLILDRIFNRLGRKYE